MIRFWPNFYDIFLGPRTTNHENEIAIALLAAENHGVPQAVYLATPAVACRTENSTTSTKLQRNQMILGIYLHSRYVDD